MLNVQHVNFLGFDFRRNTSKNRRDDIAAGKYEASWLT